MNEFDGLLPQRVPTPMLPDRGGPAAVRALARRRRRARHTKALGVGCVFVMAAGGLVALNPPDAGRGIIVTPGPTATARPDTERPGPSSPRRTHSVDEAGDPRVPTASEAGAPATTRPPVASSPPPRLPAPPDPGYTPIQRTIVDAGGPADCDLVIAAEADGLCTRFAGPWQVPAGEPVQFAFEFCAQVRDATVRFPATAELQATLSSGSGETWRSVPRPGRAAHVVDIAQGTCLRYAVHWDGRLAGRVPTPGEYPVGAWMLLENTSPEGPEVSPVYVVTIT